MSSSDFESQNGPRILLITDVFKPMVGGSGAVLEELARQLPQNISIATPDRGQPDPEAGSRPFQVFRCRAFERRLPLPPGKLRAVLNLLFNKLWVRPRALSDVRAAITRTRAQVVCLNNVPSTYWLLEALKKRCPRIPVLFYVHGEEIAAASSRSVIERLKNRAMQHSDGVIAVSLFTRDRVLGCGVAPEKVTTLYNGVDIDRFTPGEKDPALIARFGLAGKQVLLCLARLDERKGQDMLLRAMPQIVAAHPEARLLIVGSGDYEATLRGLAASLRLDEFVIFAGPATEDEVPRFYRTADFYVMPNRTTEGGDTEGFGLVFLEAGACGKAVIGGRAGGVPEAVLHGFSGLLVDGTSPEEIAWACRVLLEDASSAAIMASNGLARSAQYSWKAQAQLFLQICRNAAKAQH
jgi:phosphatidylinositol alpha-1,6-mannosyltransferase